MNELLYPHPVEALDQLRLMILVAWELRTLVAGLAFLTLGCLYADTRGMLRLEWADNRELIRALIHARAERDHWRDQALRDRRRPPAEIVRLPARRGAR